MVRRGWVETAKVYSFPDQTWSRRDSVYSKKNVYNFIEMPTKSIDINTFDEDIPAEF